MIGARAGAVLLLLSTGACGTPDPTSANAATIAARVSPANPAPGSAQAPAAPAAPAGKAEGAAHPVTLADGTRVTVQGYRQDGRRGLSSVQCSVAIGEATVATMGSGDTDSYTCGKLVEAGALPPAAGHQRIGLIYDVSSPNASFRSAVILVGDAGTWSVDAATLGRYDDTPAGRSIAGLRKALGG